MTAVWPHKSVMSQNSASVCVCVWSCGAYLSIRSQRKALIALWKRPFLWSQCQCVIRRWNDGQEQGEKTKKHNPLNVMREWYGASFNCALQNQIHFHRALSVTDWTQTIAETVTRTPYRWYVSERTTIGGVKTFHPRWFWGWIAQRSIRKL